MPLIPHRASEARQRCGRRFQSRISCALPDNEGVKAHECYHCKQWVEEDEPHDCWTTTESALTRDLAEDLQEAYQRLRGTAVEFGDQRIYASHSSIMFARKACYLFVRPKRSFLEVCIFLGRTLKTPRVRKTINTSKVKVAHIIQVRHRDEVEPPLTDWMREAYQLEDAVRAKPTPRPAVSKRTKTIRTPRSADRRR
jgi:hypothetical protein